MSNFLGVELRIINQDLIDLCTTYGALEPVVRVDLYNVTTGTTIELGSVKSFSITRSSVSNDSFSLVLGDASTYNARTTDYLNKLAARKNYWFKIYAGYKIDGTDVLIPYFVGVGHQVPEDYGPTSEAITINGYGLDYLLHLVSGVLSDQTEDISTIIQNLIDLTAIEYNFISLPAKGVTSQDFNNTKAIETIDYLLKAYTITTERYVNGEGVLVVQEKQEDEDAEFNYLGNATFTLNRTLDTSKLITVCTVRGDTAGHSATVTDATGYLANYGRKVKSISNSLITSSANATSAAQAMITDSINRMNQVRVKLPFNPYLAPGTKINITENNRSLTNAEDVYIESITATYTEGLELSNTISGYIVS